MKLDFQTYKNKVYGCYVGKAVGGTLGMPYEGDRSVRKVTYYDPVPTEMPPNDDLDLQVVNLATIMRLGLPISRRSIGEMWIRHFDDCAPDEYGVAISNHNIGLRAPLSGIYRNKFDAGMGGAIRSELWACLAPANPTLAATFAREDACTDHTQDGVFAEMFLAAAESAAFVESDLQKIIDAGMDVIESGSKLYRAFSDVRAAWKKTRDVMAIRETILSKYPSDNWTDVTINVSFILLSLLASAGDFDTAVCTAASLGYDTDCTCATAGALFGIWKPDSIGDKWTAPLGDKLVLSPCIVEMQEWNTVSEFCDAIIGVEHEVSKFYGNNVTKDFPEQTVRIAKPRYTNTENLYTWKNGAHESLIAELPFLVSIVYPDTVAMLPNKENKMKIRLQGNSEQSYSGKFSLIAPEKFSFAPSEFSFAVSGTETAEFETTVTLGNLRRRNRKNCLVLRFDINGVSFTLEAGLPTSFPWEVTDSSGNKSVFEACSEYFTVPKGAYTYRTKIKATAKKTARIACSGTRPFTCYVNGKAVYTGDASIYVAAFHRDGTNAVISLENGENEIMIEFPDYDEGEFFFGFGTTFACGVWIDTIERYL